MMEMNGGTSVPTVKEFQTEERSWAPVTPLKPILPGPGPGPGPICEVGQRSGLMGQPFGEFKDYLAKYSLPNEGPGLSLGSTCLLKTAEMTIPKIPHNTKRGGDDSIWRVDDRVNHQRVNVEQQQPRIASSNPSFGAWDMPLPTENNGGNSSVGFEDMSFGELLAMNDSALAPSLISERLEEDCGGGAVSGSSFHGLNPQLGNKSLSQQGFQQLNQQYVPHCAYPWSQSKFNSSPTTMHISGEHFAFTPQTPNPRWKADNMVARNLNGLQEHEATAAIADSQGVNGNEVADPTTGSSPGKVSIAGEGNHSPDDADSHCIDLNKTPPKKPRRKRYLPKVVKENKPKRTPKPKTPKPTDEKEGPRNRRKYVRKNKADGETKTTENKPKKRAPKSCKKSLHFDLEGEDQSKDDSNADDLSKQGNQEVSHSNQATLTKESEKATGNLMGENMGESSSAGASSNEGVQISGSKRVISSVNGKADVNDENVDTDYGTNCPPNHIYLHNVGNNGVPGFVIPDIYKKQRVDPGQGSHVWSTSSYVNACEDQYSKYYRNTLALHRSNVETSNRVEMLMRCAGNRVQLLNTWLDITRLKTPKLPEGALHDPNLDPLEGVPLFSDAKSKGKAKSDTSKTHQPGNSSHSDQVNTVGSSTGAPIEDTDKKSTPKRRSKKKNPESGSTSRGKKGWAVVLHNDNQSDRSKSGSMSILLEAITEGLKQIDLNKEQSALVPYGQNALVLYKNDGTLVPFGGHFDPVKKRQRRAKVELDDETTRVWMLLLENIDNDGIDGTDEEKRKWWENERSVFHGRVESFIARMRLVQGDRRFTPWKGSVLDSVIGVFLTQNVSDHLSSSAFMSLAARFPIKSNSCGSASSVEIGEPDVCVIQPEESITWNEKPVDRPTYGRVNNETDHAKIEDFGSQDRVRAASGSVGRIDCFSSLKVTSGSSCNKDNTHIEDTEAGNNLGNYDATSSLQSMISSQNSVDSPVNSKAQSMASSSQSDYFGCSTSFLGLLKMAGSPMLDDSYNQIFGYDLAKAPDMCSDNHQCDKEPDSQVQNTSIQMIEVQSKSCATFSKDEIEKDSLENVGTSTLGQTSPIWNGPNLVNSSQGTADVTTGSTVTLDRTNNNNHKEASGHSYPPRGASEIAGASSVKSKRQRPAKEKKNTYDWDNLRKEAQANGRSKERPPNTRDSLDWEAVRHADVSVLADTIKERGMNNVLAGRIKDFLDKLVKDHGSTDLEWLRDVPPDKAKEYLLSFRGLGLKSVECVRLLTLHHLAFPVDTNVGRIAVRLGWVPLQPLPESLQLHLLELYPILETIQQYLWPRLCKLDQKTLYELHYHLITFGKVFCTKRQPNCNACPLRGECRHFASAFASARLALPGPEQRSIVAVNKDTSIPIDPHNNIKPLPLPHPTTTNDPPHTNFSCNKDATAVEVPSTPLSLTLTLTQPTFDLERKPRVDYEPIVEVPASPEPEPDIEQSLCDIEDSVDDDPNEIPTIELNMEKFTQTLQNVMQANGELQESGMSRALVALTPEAASIPTPKLKNISRLRTEHRVYELPDTHPLLTDWDKREPDDPCSYLLAIWTPGETANTVHPPDRRCSSDDPSILCYEETCAYCSSQREANSQTVRGTLLIPCRTAMRGSFPLNGTYFQVNEVFADHKSSLNPINVPRSWLWNLPRRTVYFGTSVPTIFKGLTTEEIQHCFWRGFVCVRGFDKQSRAPRPLMARLHFPASKMPKGAKGKADEE